MQLLAYFGETDIKRCGICSVCTKTTKSEKPEDLNSLKKRIVELLESGDKSSRAIISSLNTSEAQTKTVLKLLLEHNIVTITKINTYKLSHL